MGSGGGTDESERNLDTLLTEMDSFDKDDSSSSLQLGKNNADVLPPVILLVLSATNRPVILNPVLLCPVVNEVALLAVKREREMTNADNKKMMKI